MPLIRLLKTEIRRGLFFGVIAAASLVCLVCIWQSAHVSALPTETAPGEAKKESIQKIQERVLGVESPRKYRPSFSISTALLANARGIVPHEYLLSLPYVVKADMTKYISYDISPVAAIDFLRDELSTDSRTSGAEIHALMHVVGSALYDSQGLEGLVVCLDHPLGIDVPCFHGLMLQFFRNVSSVTALDADTFKGLCSGMMISDCLNIYHGFGHGYTTYFGYDRQKALDQCLRLSGDVRGYACMQGVNMEWSEYAPFEKIEERRAKPWSLCTELRDARERGLCAFEMPRTLSFLYYGKQDLLFDLYAARDAVSDGCRAAPSAWWRALCFRGIGFMAAMRSSPEANTADICTSMPEATVADVHLCLMSAAQRLALIGTPDVAPDAYAVCKVLIRDFREKQCKHFFPDMELGSEN